MLVMPKTACGLITLVVWAGSSTRPCQVIGITYISQACEGVPRIARRLRRGISDPDAGKIWTTQHSSSKIIGSVQG